MLTGAAPNGAAAVAYLHPDSLNEFSFPVSWPWEASWPAGPGGVLHPIGGCVSLGGF